MGKKLPQTPKSQIKSALRTLWLRSRERAAAIKRDHYTCVRCGKKQSKAKSREIYVEVHHKHGVTNWQAMYDAIYAHLLADPENFETLCIECHKKEEE